MKWFIQENWRRLLWLLFWLFIFYCVNDNLDFTEPWTVWWPLIVSLGGVAHHTSQLLDDVRSRFNAWSGDWYKPIKPLSDDKLKKIRKDV